MGVEECVQTKKCRSNNCWDAQPFSFSSKCWWPKEGQTWYQNWTAYHNPPQSNLGENVIYSPAVEGQKVVEILRNWNFLLNNIFKKNRKENFMIIYRYKKYSITLTTPETNWRVTLQWSICALNFRVQYGSSYELLISTCDCI